MTAGVESMFGPWADLVTRPPNDALDLARRDAGLTRGDLFLRYLELGG